MQKKEKLMIYPYDLQSAPFVRHKKLLPVYDLIGLVSPNGWGYTGKDAAIADGGPPTGITIGNDFERLLYECDTVLFSENAKDLDFNRSIYPRIKQAIEAKKNIVATLDMNNDKIGEISVLCKEAGVSFTTFDNRYDYDAIFADSPDDEKLLKIHTPVIFVLGSGEKTHKFNLQLLLREHIMNQGYSVSQIGTRKYSQLFGMHPIPSLVLGTSLADYKKVILFNRFVRMIEKAENPDVIIIGIPGGIMPYDDDMTNKFGLAAYMISNAIEPDAAVFSSIYEDWTESYYERVCNTVKYKFGFEIDCFNQSNSLVDWTNSRQFNMVIHNFLGYDLIEEKKKRFAGFEKPVFNIFNDKDAAHLPEHIINKLADYAESTTY